MRLFNGAVYKSGKIAGKFALMFLYLDSKLTSYWGLLCLGPHEKRGYRAPTFQHDKNGIATFSEKELAEGWDCEHWELLNERIDFVGIRGVNIK